MNTFLKTVSVVVLALLLLAVYFLVPDEWVVSSSRARAEAVDHCLTLFLGIEKFSSEYAEARESSQNNRSLAHWKSFFADQELKSSRDARGSCMRNMSIYELDPSGLYLAMLFEFSGTRGYIVMVTEIEDHEPFVEYLNEIDAKVLKIDSVIDSAIEDFREILSAGGER